MNRLALFFVAPIFLVLLFDFAEQAANSLAAQQLVTQAAANLNRMVAGR